MEIPALKQVLGSPPAHFPIIQLICPGSIGDRLCIAYKQVTGERVELAVGVSVLQLFVLFFFCYLVFISRACAPLTCLFPSAASITRALRLLCLHHCSLKHLFVLY